MKSSFLIAAPQSGSGKTTIARGLMALFVQQGLTVQPFKCGPDYIDTKFHAAVCGRPSINLDTFMATKNHVKDLFGYYGREADVCVVEGMMGLFDGYDQDHGSSAEIAQVLGLPIVLVVDARSAAYSMAALLSGFLHFREDTHIAGVIFNKVGSAKHRAMLQRVCDDLGVTCFGFLPKSPSLETGSRYLGLDFSEETRHRELVAMLHEQVDWQRLLQLHSSLDFTTCPPFQPTPSAGKVLVARTAESFSFFYQETLDQWEQVTFFNPEENLPIPDDTELLYLPGGYPEKHVEALANASKTRESIRRYAERGGRILAECGGMMYLCRHIMTDEGEYPMCGVLPYSISARQADRKLSLGYRRFVLDGKEYRGHEFHYTQFLGETPPSVAQVYNATGEPVSTPVLKYKNVLASYTHLSPTPPKGEEHSQWKSSERHRVSPSSFGVERLHPVMLAGTGSDVGKSVLAAAFCRIFRQDGYQPAPFKAQNMALNSYATPEGLEIGRAQAVQAEAAGIPCHTDMNPLLLKPQSDHTSQVVLNGRPVGNRDAYDYFRKEGREELRREVCAAFDRLSQRFNPIVMEGAGSISELNLRDHDLVNLPMARHADADVFLVGDIDRGGVFASVYGSIALQTPEDRRRIKGIIINKFRGDLRLFDDGRKMLEDLCQVPVLGVVPYYHQIYVEEEDSVDLAQKSMQAQRGKVNVAVVLLRHLSNFTDFNVLERDPRVHLFYTNNTEDLLKSDIIILPGSKSTISDLYELRRNGVAQAIIRAHRKGTSVMGICGGYQMMGVEVCDPHHLEGDIERLPGLGLLPVSTTMTDEKTTRQVTFNGGMHGYEIHCGETRPFGTAEESPLATFDDGHTDGYVVDDKCMGTYIHGILDNPAFIDRLLLPFADKMEEASTAFDYHAFKEQQYDLLADHVRQHIDMERVYQILKGES